MIDKATSGEPMIDKAIRAAARVRAAYGCSPEVDRQTVLAVLEAVREPSEELIEAGDVSTIHHTDCVYSSWQRMIDHLINEDAGT